MHYRQVITRRRTLRRFRSQSVDAQCAELLHTEDLTLMHYALTLQDQRVRSLIQNPHLPSEFQLYLARRHSPAHPVDLHLELTRRDTLCLEVQHLFLDPHTPTRTRSQMAASAALDPSLQEGLLEDSPRVRKYLASSPLLLPTHQVRLANDPDADVRGWLASNTSTTLQAAQEILSRDYFGISANLTQNTSLLPALQHQLARNPNEFLRTRLATNPALIEEVAALLSRDTLSVQDALARNPAVRVHPALSVAFCLSWRSHELSEYFTHLSTHLSPSELAALADNWVGSLAELQEAVLLLAPRS